MFIPFGTQQPGNQEEDLLKKLGFDLNKMKLQGKLYYLEVPTSQEFKHVHFKSAYNSTKHIISFNNIHVISAEIIVKHMTFTPIVKFNLDVNNILLATNNTNEIQHEINSKKSKL